MELESEDVSLLEKCPHYYMYLLKVEEKGVYSAQSSMVHIVSFIAYLYGLLAFDMELYWEAHITGS